MNFKEHQLRPEDYEEQQMWSQDEKTDPGYHSNPAYTSENKL